MKANSGKKPKSKFTAANMSKGSTSAPNPGRRVVRYDRYFVVKKDEGLFDLGVLLVPYIDDV